MDLQLVYLFIMNRADVNTHSSAWVTVIRNNTLDQLSRECFASGFSKERYSEFVHNTVA